MSKKKFRGKSFFRRRQQGGPIGQVTVEGELLEVDFLYSAERVQAIKTIPQARFHPETKKWTIPLRNRELLERSLLLGREVLDYRFAAETPQVESEERLAAEARWRANPFDVSIADLELIRPEVVFALDSNQTALRARPRFRSIALSLLSKNSAVHYIKPEKCFSFPVEALADTLKQFRDKNITFAVESLTAERLRETSSIRARLRENSECASGEELLQALCVPFLEASVDEEGNPRFAICYFSSQQLKECFPEIKSFGERRALARDFDAQVLVGLLALKKRLPFTLWQSSDATWHIRQLQERFAKGNTRGMNLDESLARFISLPACWVKDSKGVTGLLIQKQEFERLTKGKHLHPWKKLERSADKSSEDCLFFSIPSSRLFEVKREIEEFLSEEQEAPFSVSEEFTAFLPEISARLKARLANREYRLLKDTSCPPEQFSEEELPAKLFPHQRVGLRWLLENQRAFLGDDMGLGKTLSVLSAFDVLSKREEVEFLLVVCPNSLLRNWQRESRQWFPKRRFAVLPEEKREKIGLLKRIGWNGIALNGLFVNYESVRLEYVRVELEKLLLARRAMLCLDESQRVKNPTGKTFHALKTLTPLCQHRVLLSGTPTPKALSDIWSQMFLLDDGERFGSNYYDWLASVAELGNRYSAFAVKKFKPEEVQESVGRVQELLLRRRKEEVLSLPEKTFIVRDIELKGDQAKRYEEVRKELLLRMTSLNGKSFLREINNILEEYLRAVQIASNPRLVDSSWNGTPAKFEETDELLNEIVAEREEKVVLWTNYLDNVRELVERYKQFGSASLSGEVSLDERDRVVEEFQRGKNLKVLVAVPAAGGVGLTLTAAQTAIYLEKTWNAEHWFQSIDRLHRIGQTGTVRIISLHASRVDELISSNLARKSRDQAALLGDREGFVNAAESFPAREELIEAVAEKTRIQI